MDLLPFRVAAGGGSIDGLAAARLVAAGVTLLQRSVMLVRTLAARRSAILLPLSPQYLVALAASDGRSAVLLDPLTPAETLASRLGELNVGAVFTMASFVSRLPPGFVHALLDDAPALATVVAADGTRSRVDLGSHFGLSLDGDADAPGRDEECLVEIRPESEAGARTISYTHRELIADARRALTTAAHASGDSVRAVATFSGVRDLTAALFAPLMAGAHISTLRQTSTVKNEPAPGTTPRAP